MNYEIIHDPIAKHVLEKANTSSRATCLIEQNRLGMIISRPKTRMLVVGTLFVLLVFLTVNCNFYRSAKLENQNALVSDSLAPIRANEADGVKYLAFTKTKAATISDSLAQLLAVQARLIAKTEPDLSLKLIKEAYRITEQHPPAEVRQTLAALFYEQLNRMPVLEKEFDIQGNPRELMYAEARQAYLIFMEDGRVMEWESSLQSPKPYLLDNTNAQILPNEELLTDQNQSKTFISPSKQYSLSIPKQAQASAYIKNQKGEVVGFFSSGEQINHACFGEYDKRILTISPEGKGQLWALDGLSTRDENPWISDQSNWGAVYPSFIKTAKGLKLLDKDGEVLKELVLEQPFDQMEVAALGERIITFEERQNRLYYWDMEGRLLQTIEHEDEISKVSISADGRLAIVLTYQEPTSGRVYDLRTGQIYPTLDTLLTDGLLVAAFSPGIPSMITHVDYGLTLGIWDFNGNKVREISPNGLVEMLYFSPQGTYFHTQSDGKDGQIWDQEGNLLGTTDKNIRQLKFSPDESRIYYLMTDGDEDNDPDKRSLPTLSRYYKYLMEQLDLAELSMEEKARFGL